MADNATRERRRHWRRTWDDRLFAAATRASVLLALGFVAWLLGDVVRRGASAFWQAELLVPLESDDAARDMPPEAAAQPWRELVSGGWRRDLPLIVTERSGPASNRPRQWVLANSDVDQALKGKASRLTDGQRRHLEEMRQSGRTRLALNLGFFTRGDSLVPERAGVAAAIHGSCLMLLLALVVSFPVGVMTAIYLEEFAAESWLTQGIEASIDHLAATPSVLFGLLGLACFVLVAGLSGPSALVGGLTLAVMVLPTVVISSREALRGVPTSVRLAAISVGATRWQSIRDHVLPQATRGILTGTIQGLTLALGAAAPLIIVGAGTLAAGPAGRAIAPAPALPTQIYAWFNARQAGYEEKSAAAIMVLLAALLALNTLGVVLRARLTKPR